MHFLHAKKAKHGPIFFISVVLTLAGLKSTSPPRPNGAVTCFRQALRLVLRPALGKMDAFCNEERWRVPSALAIFSYFVLCNSVL